MSSSKNTDKQRPRDLQRQVENKIDVTKRGSTNVLGSVFKQQMSLMRNDMLSLKVAFQQAEAIVAPSRLRLYEIYHEVEREAQVSSLLQSRKIKALGKEFELVGKNGKATAATKEATELLKSTWFQKIMSLAWDAIPYGYSLIQLGDIVNSVPTAITLVPRQNVRPEEGIVIPFPGSISGVEYLSNPWTLPCGDPTDLGLLAKVAKSALFKSHAESAQAKGVDLFGTPFRFIKMDMSNEQRVEDSMQQLSEMGTSAFGVFDTDQELELVEPKTSAANPHDVFIKRLDEQISKVIFGQTMMADNGSSRSQSEVHERLGNDYTLWDLKYLESTINDEILPRLLQLGFPFKDMVFRFLKGENVAELFDMTIKAMNTPNTNGVDMKWFSEKFGIKFNEADKVQPHESTAVADEDAASSESANT